MAAHARVRWWSSIRLVIVLILGTVAWWGCVRPPPPSSDLWTGSALPRVLCPTPTAMPTIEMVEVATVVVDETPTVVTTVTRTEPYELEYGYPIRTPTPYARSLTTARFTEIVEFEPGWLVQVHPPRMRREPQAAVAVVTITMESDRPRIWEPWWQVGVSVARFAGWGTRTGFWPPPPPAPSPSPSAGTAMATPDGRDAALRIPIPTGRSEWQWEVRFPPDTEVQAVQFRLQPPGARTGPPVAVTWVDATLAASGVWDVYCPQSAVGTWGSTSDEVGRVRLPDQPILPPLTTSQQRRQAVAAAIALLGYPYCFGGKGWNRCAAQCFDGTCYPGCSTPPCYDCSGLVHAAWHEAGVALPHGSMNQAAAVVRRPSLDALEPGDLLFFYGTGARSATIGHVAIYVGDINGDGRGDMIHASWYDRPSHIVYGWEDVPALRRRFAFAGSPRLDR